MSRATGLATRRTRVEQGRPRGRQTDIGASCDILAAASLDGGRVDRLFAGYGSVLAGVLVLVHVVGVAALLGGGRRVWRGVGVVMGGVALFGLIALFWASETAWRDLKSARGASGAGDVQRALVVGRQFEWSVVYPGPDGRVGAYLEFPEPTDERWPNPLIIDAATAADPPVYRFRGATGPVALPAEERESATEAYVGEVNPLGKDFADPAGWDDDWKGALGRPLRVEANRPVEVTLGSADVIHDFFVPALRVKRDAVPGMLGPVRFTPTRAGTYDLVCAEFCGWGHATMLGTVEVTP